MTSLPASAYHEKSLCRQLLYLPGKRSWVERVLDRDRDRVETGLPTFANSVVHIGSTSLTFAAFSNVCSFSACIDQRLLVVPYV